MLGLATADFFIVFFESVLFAPAFPVNTNKYNHTLEMPIVSL